jgi:hypothetical protein
MATLPNTGHPPTSGIPSRRGHSCPRTPDSAASGAEQDASTRRLYIDERARRTREQKEQRRKAKDEQDPDAADGLSNAPDQGPRHRR